MKLRYKLAVLILLVGGWYLALKRFPGGLINPVVPHILPANDTAQVIVNPVTHQLIVVTAHGSTTTTLPDHVSTIDVHHDGTINVTAKQFGLEARPFAGAFYSNKLRFGAGLDGMYWKKLDLGLGVAGGSSAQTVVFAQIGYNIWSNVRIGITYDHQQRIGCGITVRI